MRPCLALTVASLAAALTLAPPQPAQAQTPATVQAKAAEEVPAILQTIKELVGIESGSSDLEGLPVLSSVVAGRLKSAGMAV